MLYQPEMDKAKEFLTKELEQTKNQEDKEALQLALDYISRQENKYQEVWEKFHLTVEEEIATWNETLAKQGLVAKKELYTPHETNGSEQINVKVGVLKGNNPYNYLVVYIVNYNNQEFRSDGKIVKPNLSSLKKILSGKMHSENTKSILENIRNVVVNDEEEE